MTSMPQLVSLFNAVGGGAAALLALRRLLALDGHRVLAGGAPGLDGWRTLFILADVVIGSVTFTGSLIASAKLMGIIRGQPIILPGGRILSWLAVVVAAERLDRAHPGRQRASSPTTPTSSYAPAGRRPWPAPWSSA